MDHNAVNTKDHAGIGLFNDVYFNRAASQPNHDTWPPFPRLPTELRLRVWLLFLRRHRMIEISIAPADDEDLNSYPGDHTDATKARYYIHRNSLGNLISSRGYMLFIKGRGVAPSLNPLLWVNREARHAALSFYRVHFPFPGPSGQQVLYLNPEYDVLYVFPDAIRLGPTRAGFQFGHATSRFVDFLCDVRAYDPKGRGAAHIALGRLYSMQLLERRDDDIPPIHPTMLHPFAASQFTDILRHSLRTVLCIIPFRHGVRGLPDSDSGPSRFAHTLPLHRQSLPAGAFTWLESDPRPGVQLDLAHMSLVGDPLALARGWKKLERVFGVEEREGDRGSPFYICPTLHWSPAEGPEWEAPVEGDVGYAYSLPRWTRGHLGRYLEEEWGEWVAQGKSELGGGGEGSSGGEGEGEVGPRLGDVGEPEGLDMLDRLSDTAVGMWVLPPEAFVKERSDTQERVFDVSVTRPGLLLFDVGEW